MEGAWTEGRTINKSSHCVPSVPGLLTHTSTGEFKDLLIKEAAGSCVCCPIAHMGFGDPDLEGVLPLLAAQDAQALRNSQPHMIPLPTNPPACLAGEQPRHLGLTLPRAPQA